MLRKLLAATLLTISSVTIVYAQIGQGALKGKVTDKETKEALPFVNVVLELNGTIVTGAASDFDGNFTIKPIPPGKYNLKATFTGYQPVQISGVVITSDKITFQNIAMTSAAIDIKEFEVIEYAVPLISKDNTATGATVTREDIDKLPGRSATSVAQTVGGVYSKDDGKDELNIRGGRSDANYYFIDGIKVRGSSSIPKASIEQVTVITGGLPAQYGDITGGVVSITTRGASKEYSGSVDYSTSGYKIGDKMVGLDPYGFNLIEGSVSGPLYSLKDSTGKITKPLLGFFLSGNYNSMIDENPSAIGWWKVKEDVRTELIENPLRTIPGSPGTFLNHEFVRFSDLEKVKTRQNAAKNGFTIAGKIDVNTGSSTNLTFGGNLDFRKSREFRYNNSLMNWDNNAELVEKTWRVYSRFTQRFGSGDSEQDQKSASTIKNAFYSVQMDYNKDRNLYQDDIHKDDLFKYGYVGKFKTYRARYYEVDPSYNGGQGAFVQRAFRDTLIGFEAGDANYELAQFTQAYYDLFGWEGYDSNGKPKYDFSKSDPLHGTGGNSGGFYYLDGTNGVYPEFFGDREGFFDDMVRVQQFGALRNGDQPRDIYGLWRAPSFQYDNYEINNNSQFRINATGSADINDHAISIGFEYEQRVDRGYQISPVGLWTLGRLLTNSHITNLDTSKPTSVDAGMQFPVIQYEQQNASPGEYDKTKEEGEAQSFFDYNLRNKLTEQGIITGGTDGVDWIDFDSYDISTYTVDMFSADELNTYFKSGSTSRIDYFGYDHTGKRTTDNPSFDDFFTARDKYGNYTRPIGAFRPVYVAGFIQDKFSFEDLIFNIGLRVDRFDANQKVLKDPYSLFPTVKAGEDLTQYGIKSYEIPSNIGDDYVVYTDDVANPTKIVGFRNGDKWYNAEGAELSGGNTIRIGGEVHPLLVDNSKTASKDITSEAFQDYKPQTNFMPRIAFSFPISDEALFFAHYDVLTKRPTQGPFSSPINRLNPTDYYYLEAVSYTLNNPDLKPEKTIDYEAGYQQKLNNSSSLKLSAFYRELRNQVQVINVMDAYPRKYQTFGNIDFGTVKGLTVSYDLRRTGNLQMRAAYTLQFAEGTGSDSQSGLGLARADKQSLRTNTPLNYDQRHSIITTFDYRYGAGKDYDGPVILGKQIFANTGANLVFNAGSGTPYNRHRNITDRAHILPTNSAVLLGQINGSRLPWQFRADARIDREIELKWKVKGEGEEKVEKTAQMNVYLQILNLFNTKNIVDVYGATGNPDDDGYLNAAQYQTIIQQQNDEQSYRELYSAKVNYPLYYNLPRRLRLGILVNF